MKKIFQLNDIISAARSNSRFYKDLYRNLSVNPKLSDLPLIDQREFWNKNEYKNNCICTEEIRGGVIFKSGGTTGAPKFSWYKKDEWETFTTLFGEGISQLDLNSSDRVANLFYVGEMYASFLFINKSFENAPLNCLQFPIAGHTSLESTLNSVNDYGINVLVGVPTTFVQIAIFLEKNLNPKMFLAAQNIEKIFYGGEALFIEQEILLKRVFKNLKVISSIGYASVDAGHLGYSTKNSPKGIHEVFSDSTIMELIDEESGAVINSANCVGKLVYTNLTRIGMPILRYPVGDKGKWCEGFIGKKFELLGRSEEGARVGPVTVSRDDILQTFKSAKLYSFLDLFQLQIERIKGFDQLSLLFSSRKMFSALEIETLREHFYLQRKMFKECILQGILAPIIIKQIFGEEFSRNPRTGKLIFISDKRFN